MGILYDLQGNDLMKNYYVTPEMFGAVGDGTANDTNAIQQAVNASGYIVFCPGKTYKTTSAIRLKKNKFLDLNGAKIICTYHNSFYNFDDGDSYSAFNGNGNIKIANGYLTGGGISFIHGEHIMFTNMVFFEPYAEHYMEIASCKNLIIDGCSFIGMRDVPNAALEYVNIDTNATYSAFPHNKSGENDPVFYDGHTNEDITVRNCYFSVGTGEFAYGFDAVGVHSRNTSGTYAQNVTIENNKIIGFSGCGLRLNAMDGVMVSGNNIQTVGDGIRIGDVADAKNLVIKDNYVVSSSGQKLVRTNGQYTNLTVANNVTEGDTQVF